MSRWASAPKRKSRSFSRWVALDRTCNGASTDDEEKPQNASLLKGMTPEAIDLETALKLLTLPRESGRLILRTRSRLSPTMVATDRTSNVVRIPAPCRPTYLPLDVTQEQALFLLAQPKTRGRGAAKKEPLKVFEVSPITEKPVQILDGRFGPYITDGTTNISLRKGMMPEEITFDEALSLLAEKAALGPAPTKKKAAKKKSATKKSAAKKAPAKKKSTTKKSTTKKSATKKAPAKKSVKKNES